MRNLSFNNHSRYVSTARYRELSIQYFHTISGIYIMQNTMVRGGGEMASRGKK